MARGGRSHGNSIKNQGSILQTLMDMISRNTRPATLIGGTYTFSGNQTTFRAQSQIMPTASQEMMPATFMQQIPLPGAFNLENRIYPQPNITMQSMMGQQMTSFGNQGMVLQADITIVGTKTKQASDCCFNLTIILASFIILPIFFICCMWWKKIVYPTYQLGIGAYHDIANFISKYPNLKHLSLTVADNAFNAEKARLLYDALSHSRIGGFEFSNRVLDCNGKFNEADSFRENMSPIKSLNMPTNIVWGDMIL